MMSSTATAKPVPCDRVNSGSVAGSPAEASSSARAFAASTSGGRPAGATRPRANGTTASDTIGAATMPSATTDWPEAIPTATARANSTREEASISTSPPYRPKRCEPARNPRAK